ncbi:MULTISPECIES: hypothetical protein [unclassified Streptomyces]|uniref:DUF6197 family protein n=1 Tax=unclassified Streptomyces TaxID=2593676 RepID=UPI00365A90BE
MNPTLPTNPPDDVAVSELPAALRVRPLVIHANTVEATLTEAAWLLRTRGHWQGGSCPDASNREMCIPQWLRPMSIVAAIKCAVSGDPQSDSLIADNALAVVALSLADKPQYGDIFSLEEHIDSWGNEPDRSTDDVVAMLEHLTATLGRAA